MGGDTIESLKELLTALQLAFEAQKYAQAEELLEKLLLNVTQNPQSVTKELYETLENFEEELKKKKEEVVARMYDLQNLKKYSS